MINGISLQLYRQGLLARDVYRELKKYFYEKKFDVKGEGFLTTKFALWIDTRRVLTTFSTAAVRQ